MTALIALLGGVRATVFAGLALVLLAAVGVQSWRLDSAQDALAEQTLAAAKALADATNDARERERDLTNQFADLSGRLIQENEDARVEVDRLLAGLRDGTERLRQRFRCPAGGVPGAAAGAGGSDAAAEAGLRRADAEFLVRESERADAVVRQLTACQALLDAERKAQPAGGP